MPGRCHECGKELPADAPDGLCPACLLREVLETVGPNAKSTCECARGGSDQHEDEVGPASLTESGGHER